MRIGLVGLTTSGKTTLFNTLTGAELPLATFEGPGAQTHLQQVEIPDPRLAFLAEVCEPEKVTPARLELLDAPGFPLGPDEPREGEQRLLAALRETDGLLLVLRSFKSDNVPHPLGSIDPARDFAELQTALQLADLQTLENRIQRLQVSLQKPTATHEQEKKELALLQRCRDALEAGGRLTEVQLNPAEQKLLRSFQFLTLKPQLLVLNIGEDEVSTAHEGTLSYLSGGWPSPPIPVCAELQMEIGQLDEADREAFSQDLGVSVETLHELLRTAYRRLGCVCFFTTVGKEVKAWLLPEGETTLDAAGKIHSDMARGFIRAEVVPFEVLKEAGSFKEARAQGKVRLEGKDHIVHDGDAITFRFSP